MNRSKRRQVFECASPLALSRVISLASDVQNGRGLLRSKTLSRGCQQRRGSPPPHLASFPAEAGAECGVALTRFGDSLGRILWRWEIAAFASLIALFNLPLLTGVFSTQFIYHPDAVNGGEWWRVFTYPFVHVSCYHLVLDALAFFLAYAELHHRRFPERLAFAAAASAGSLLAALAASPLIAAHGLCGLSGIAHGLTAVVSLEMLRRSDDPVSRWSGLFCFVGVTGKSLLELVTGQVLFALWHPGWLGTPIAACHAGGVLGAVLFWIIFQGRQSSSPAWYKDNIVQLNHGWTRMDTDEE
jgi:rhomboid family GlyGly-CTERM serine protease